MKNKILKPDSNYPLSDHFDGEVFHNNPDDPADHKGFADMWKWQMTAKRAKWPRWVENKATPRPQKPTTESQVVCTFINHVTFLFQIGSLNILTDPFFSDRTSPLQWLGPKRVRPPGLKIENLPKIDVILLSHNHFDHMDTPALQALNEKFQPLCLTPLGNKIYLDEIKFSQTKELDWWDKHSLQNIDFHLTPARHWSRRKLSDTRKALWGGFSIKWQNQHLFFAGDTGYGAHFKEIHQKLGDAQLSFLPIGAYEPRWFMESAHMNPEDAIQAHLDLKARKSIGMHYGCVQLTDEGFDQPVIDLQAVKQAKQIENFDLLEVGETKIFDFNHLG